MAIVSKKLQYPVDIVGISAIFNNSYEYLDVNFVNNFNVASGFFDRALLYFVHISEKYPKHAFAQYVLANIYEQKNEKDLAKIHHDAFIDISNKDMYWKSYAEKFDLLRA